MKSTQPRASATVRGLRVCALVACVVLGAAEPAAPRLFASTWASSPVRLAEDDDPDEGSTKELAVKVGFLYNFTLLIEWPDKAFDEDDAPFIIGVLGKNADGKPTFGELLEKTLDGKSVGRHRIVVRRYEKFEKAREAHILYLGTSVKKDVRALAGDLAKQTTLSVSSQPEFGEQGGMIGFEVVKGKVKFTINKDVASKSGLKLSSKLLSLAEIVSTKKDTRQ